MGIRVPPIGPTNADIILVGEAPGRIEVVTGQPFVGPADGQLDRMINAAGLERGDLYITNVIKEQVPDDPAEKDRIFFQKKQPTHRYMEGILELIHEIQMVRSNGGAKVVVPLGNYALWALRQHVNIMNWRGSIVESTLIPGLKVIPTIHPDFYVHGGGYNSPKEALGIWDFEKIARESKFPEIRPPKWDYIVNPSDSEIEYAIDRLLHADHMTVDTEWYGPEQLAYIGFSDSADWAICIPATNMKAYRAYKTLLSSDVPKIFQNQAFDVLALHRQGIEVRGVIHDTMIAWHACWGDIGEKSLEVIASVLTDFPYYKSQLDYVQRGDDRGQVYNANDCVATDLAWQRIEKEEFDYTRGRRGYEITHSIMPIFTEGMKIGVRADKARMEEMAVDALQKADFVEQVLSDTIGYKINCRSAPQVIKLVFDELKVGRKKRTSEQGELMDIAASTKDEEIKAILTAVIRVRQNRNIVSRYLEPKNAIDKDGRIRTNWNFAGTRGGARLSATIFGKGEQRWFPSVPMQTIPEEARVCYIADPGCVFVGCDLEQAEARVVAIKTRDYELLNDMERGVDIHTKLAAMLPFGKTYEQLVAAITQAAVEGKSKDTVIERYLSKKCRHGLNYVMGAGTFRSTVNKEWLDTGIGLTDFNAKTLRKAYIELHPGLEVWWAEVKALAKRNPRMMTDHYGRSHMFLGQFNEAMHREMVSYEPQANVADTISVGVSRAYPRLKKLDPKMFFWAHMHDGAMMQIKEDCALEAAAILKECCTIELMIDRQPLTIPVEVKMGPNWLDMQKVKV